MFSLFILSSGRSYSLFFCFNFVALYSFLFIFALFFSKTEDEGITAVVYNDTNKKEAQHENLFLKDRYWKLQINITGALKEHDFPKAVLSSNRFCCGQNISLEPRYSARLSFSLVSNNAFPICHGEFCGSELLSIVGI